MRLTAHVWLCFACFASNVNAQLPANTLPQLPPRQWTDIDTGHRIIRLSDEGGSATLYFHDTAYSPDGDKFIFNTPSGLAVLEVAAIGTPSQKIQILAPGSRRGIMARGSREVYVSRGGRGQRDERGQLSDGVVSNERGGAPQIFAIHLDTVAERLIPNAVSTIISADESWGFVVANGAEDPTGKTQRPPFREAKPQLERMFPGKKLEDLTLDQQYSVNKEDGLARRAVNPAPAAYTFINLKSGIVLAMISYS